MGRILAIDYGKKRCGLAVSDPLRICANGLDTLPPHVLIPFLKRYCTSEPVDKIIVGAPRRLDGTDSENMARVRVFLTKLRAALPDMEIEEVDERFTSTLAHRAMAQAGIHKRTLRDRGLPDRTAAILILTNYLQYLTHDTP